MTRKALVIAVLTVVMGSHMTACSSSGGKDDSSVAESNDETFAEEGQGDFADKSASSSTDAPPAEGGGDQQVTTDAKPEDTGGDLSLDGDQPAQTADAAPPADAAPTDAAPPTDVAATDKPADELSLDDPGALPEDTASTTPAPENITDNPAAPSDAGVFDAQKPAEAVVDSTPAPEPVADVAPAPSPKHYSGAVAYAPLMKVKESAFTGPGGATLNRIYIARPKDTAKSISQKVYGAPTHSKDLVKWNPVLKRGVRAGDKVYYSSAANPSDSKMMNFYEEAGVQPQTYVTKNGDNLRKVSKSLLGFNDAWKEVWETNPSVESKGKIPAGLSLAYWPESGTAAPVQTMAATTPPTDSANPGMPTTLPEAAPQVPPQANNPPPVANVAGAPPADPFNAPPPTGSANPPGQAVADNGAGPDPLAPPPPNDAAAAGVNPAPPVAAGTVAATDPLAPPAPAQNQAAPQPVKPVKAKKAPAVAAADEGGMDPDTTMALGVGGVLLLAAAILFVVIRKNRAKRMDLGQTQV
jgi:hypothetical protein